MAKANPTVVVTGATSGIGEAFARALPATFDLILVGRSADVLDGLKAELSNDTRMVTAVAADLAEPDGLEAVVDAAMFVPLRGLINCAGTGSLGPFVEADHATEAATVAVNCTAVVHLTSHLLPHMLDTADASGERAWLINVSSTAAFAPVPRMAVYAASKAFVLSFTEAITAELAREPIDVVALCPGATKSDFGRRAGFRFGSMPGALSASKVARIGLDAVGRRSVVFTDTPSRLALSGAMRARAALSRILNRGIGLVQNF